MEYGWIRQWARDVTNAPELATVMQEAETQNSDSWLDRIVNAAKKVLPGAVSTAQAALAQLSYSGSTGNFQSAEETIALTAKFQPIVDQYPEKIGSPLYRAVVINTLSGFVLCRDAVIGLSIATGREEEAVTSFMNSGFYYE